MQEAGNHLKSNKDIINDIISNPVIEYNPEDYMMTIKGKHFMSNPTYITDIRSACSVNNLD